MNQRLEARLWVGILTQHNHHSRTIAGPVPRPRTRQCAEDYSAMSRLPLAILIPVPLAYKISYERLTVRFRPALIWQYVGLCRSGGAFASR